MRKAAWNAFASVTKRNKRAQQRSWRSVLLESTFSFFFEVNLAHALPYDYPGLSHSFSPPNLWLAGKRLWKA